MPAVDKRVDDVQHENYHVPTMMYGQRVLKEVERDGWNPKGYEYTEADYVDGRDEATYDVPDVTLRKIDDAKQVKQLVRVNALLKQLVEGKTATVAQMRSALTQEQYKEYLYKLTTEQDTSEINYGNGMPDELRSYNRKLKAADFQQAKYEKMSGLASTGRARYKHGTVSKALNKAESLYESALERLEEIWGVATPAELYELQNWMDRDIDFYKGFDRTIGICVDSIPRVRGSKSHRALDSGLPKLSKRLKRQECQMLALREAAWDIAFEREQDEYVTSPVLSAKLKALLANIGRDDD
jgi:hypothetical protein